MTVPVRERLVAMLERDQATRALLVEEGRLFQGYAAEMEAVHVENAHGLEAMLDEIGWPGLAAAGEDGSVAAWTIAMHAIGLPAFQRRCLDLVTAAAGRGDMPPAFAAMLEDRIRFNERRPQRYGTIFDWDERGKMSPWPLENAARVDALRAEAGLPPLAEQIQRARRAPREKGDRAPDDYAARQREIEAWAKKAGWIA